MVDIILKIIQIEKDHFLFLNFYTKKISIHVYPHINNNPLISLHKCLYIIERHHSFVIYLNSYFYLS